jgi:hypothetical protein
MAQLAQPEGLVCCVAALWRVVCRRLAAASHVQRTSAAAGVPVAADQERRPLAGVWHSCRTCLCVVCLRNGLLSRA